MNSQRSDQFSTAIRMGGLRMTKQRSIILDILEQSQDHLDADKLHDLVKRQDPQIGLATVYRTLALLKDFGLVNENNLGEEHGHFETISDTPHYHFTCLSCKRVIEFEVPFLDNLIDSFRKDKEITLSRVNLTLEGYCPDCQKGC